MNELEKIYEDYFPFEHQKCSDECGKKGAEIRMREDFVEEIEPIILKARQEALKQFAQRLRGDMMGIKDAHEVDDLITIRLAKELNSNLERED